MGGDRFRSGRSLWIVGAGPVCAALVRGAERARLAVHQLSWVESAREDLWAGLGAGDCAVLTVQQGDMGAMFALPTEQRRAELDAGFDATLSMCRETGAWPVVVSSAMVCGTRPPGVVIDDDEPFTAAGDSGLIGDLIQASTSLDAYGGPVTVLRPAALVGGGVDSLTTRHFEAPRVLAVRGVTMEWQFLHVDDLADAAVQAGLARMDGALTVGAPRWLETHQVLKLSNMRSLTVPAIGALATAERLHRAGMLPSPATDLQFVVYPWPVTSRRLVEAGWRPRYDNPAAFQAMLADIYGKQSVVGRRLTGRDALTASAAGAAVAAIGTAALVKRGRRR